MKVNGDGMTKETLVQEEKLIETEIDVEKGEDVGLMIGIVILKEGHQEELEVKIAGDDPKETKGVHHGESEMGQLGAVEMIVAHVMIEVLEEEMTVDLVVVPTVVLVEEMTEVEETTVAHRIGGPVQENLIEMTKVRGTVTAVMIGVIEAREEVTIGELDQEWVTEIVEVPEIVDPLLKINPFVVKKQQMEMKGNGKLSVNVNYKTILFKKHFNRLSIQ